MKEKVKYRKKPLCHVTIEFDPVDTDERYTEVKKRSVLKIIFEGFEKREG